MRYCDILLDACEPCSFLRCSLVLKVKDHLSFLLRHTEKQHCKYLQAALTAKNLEKSRDPQIKSYSWILRSLIRVLYPDNRSAQEILFD
jgi:hypothetical protein